MDLQSQEVAAIVVKRDDGIQNTTVGRTAYGLPDVVLKVMSPFAIIAVRASRVYLQTLVGLLSAGALGAANNVLPVGDFWHLLRVCAGLSVASAGMCALQNALELVSKIDQSHPQLRG